MTLFLRHLMKQLDLEDPAWQESTLILLDNAAWHSSAIMKGRLAKMRLPIIYSGTYSYATAPCEQVFASLKFGELNPDKLPTGKKSLSHIVEMVAQRLSAIPRSTAIKYWHYVVLNHYSNLSLEKI